MARKFTNEEFQEFIVEQFGKLAMELSDGRGDVASIRSEIQAGLADVRGELRTGLAGVRHEMQIGFRELRTEIEEMKGILEPLVKAFDADAEKLIEHDRRILRVEKHLAISGPQ